MGDKEVINLEQIVKALHLRLEYSNKKRDTQSFVRANISSGTGFLIALVKNNAPMSDHPQCPWDTRYVFLYTTDDEVPRIHVYFFDEPYNREEEDKIYMNGFYSDSKESQDLLYYHALEHLALGVTPINASKSLLKL